jgi:hypothetical protein
MHEGESREELGVSGGGTAADLPPPPRLVPAIYPNTRCRLKLLKMERIKDHLLMEEEFVMNQERLKPSLSEDKTVEERTRVDDLRGSPMSVGTLEEIIDDDHAIVSSSSGPEYYVSILSFVDKDLLEPGCAVLLHHKAMAIVGVLQDDADPMVSMMKVDKAPTESYADIGGESEFHLSLALELMRGLQDWSSRYRRSRSRSSYLSHIQNCTRRWESSLRRVRPMSTIPIPR